MNTKLFIATLVTLAIFGSAIDPRQFGDGSTSAAATSFRAAASSAAESSAVLSYYASIPSAAAVSASASSAAALGTETPTGTDTLEAVLPVSYTTTGKIFPPSPTANGVVVPQDFSVNCINCSITGDISLAGGGKFGGDTLGFTVDTPPDLLVIHPEFDFIQKWVAASLDNLTAHFEFGLNLTASNNTNELIVPLPSISVSKNIDKVVTITFSFDPEIHGWVNTTQDVNFTYGFDFVVQPGSEVLISLDDPFNSMSLGFNQSTLTPLDLTSTTGDIDMALELSFRPAVSFQIDLFDGYGANANASAYVDVPKLDVQVKQVHNATSSCDPAPASLPAAQVYANLTNIVPSIGFDAFAVAAETELIFLNQHQGYNKSWTIHNFSTACVQYNAAKKTLGPPSKSGSTTSTHVSVAGVLLAMIMAVFATM